MSLNIINQLICVMETCCVFSEGETEYLNTGRVPAVLLQGNSTDAYISYQSLLPESLSKPDHSIRIVEYNRKNYYYYPET
jgi:hypothetical protein